MSQQARVILITTPWKPEWIERLRAIAPEFQIENRPASAPFSGKTSPAGLFPDDLWQQVEIIYTLATLPTPEQAPRLRWVQLHSAGADHLLSRPIYQSSTLFTTTSGIHAIPIAEYVLAVVLAWSHRLSRIFEWQGQGQWPPDEQRWPLFVPDELWGKTIGIAGYGSIGRQVARLATSYGMRVLAMQRGTDHHDTGFIFPGVGDPDGTLPERYYTPDQFHEMLRESDVVVIALPVTPATEGLFNEAAFRAMKPSALLVNIARGRICDEAALVRALEEQWIAGAALDVFQQEPLPPGHPLWRLPNVILSPHISGFTPHYDERAAAVFTENLRRYVAGETLLNVVDKTRGY